MAYTAFNSTEILPTKPVKTELWVKTKDNFDDHQSRIVILEGSTLTTQPLRFTVIGSHDAVVLTGISYMRIPYNMTITAAQIFIPIVGTAGTLTVDVQKKSGVGAFSTIFTTKPSILFSVGDYAYSSNGALVTSPLTGVLAGDILRVDTTTLMTGCQEFQVYIYHEVA